MLQRLADAGNTVLVIEHNLDVIKQADWVVDLGPEGGEEGGELIAAGTPEEIAEVEESYTGPVPAAACSRRARPLPRSESRHRCNDATPRVRSTRSERHGVIRRRVEDLPRLGEQRRGLVACVPASREPFGVLEQGAREPERLRRRRECRDRLGKRSGSSSPRRASESGPLQRGCAVCRATAVDR